MKFPKIQKLSKTKHPSRRSSRFRITVFPGFQKNPGHRSQESKYRKELDFSMLEAMRASQGFTRKPGIPLCRLVYAFFRRKKCVHVHFSARGGKMNTNRQKGTPGLPPKPSKHCFPLENRGVLSFHCQQAGAGGWGERRRGGVVRVT